VPVVEDDGAEPPRAEYLARRPRPIAGRVEEVTRPHRIASALFNPSLLRLSREQLTPEILSLGYDLGRVYSSSEALTESTAEWFEESFGSEIRDYYGSTETYPTIGLAKDDPVVPGSLGRQLPGMRVELVDADGNVIDGAGQAGEICMRGGCSPQYPLGYWNAPAARVQLSAASGREQGVDVVHSLALQRRA
jgi:acetyl-CoA synthetase